MTEHLMESRYIALYCRVSTDEQAREGVSLSEQQERLKAYCRAMGWNDDVKLYIDDGYSAKSTDRPQLNQLMKKIQLGEISKVMVTKLDRMSRRLLDLLTLIDTFQERQVSFISISESFDTNTPSGRLTLQVLGAVAEFERERIRERVFENMLYAAQQGKWLTQSPYGYRLEDKVLTIYEPEAEVVRRVYDYYVNKGQGFYSIAKQLNEQGIPSRKNKEWSIRSIKLMLTNPVYKGTLVWNRMDSSKKKRKEKEEEEWVVQDDTLPRIIEKDTWEQAQKQSKKPPIAPRAKTSPHLLGGLLKCGNCGSGMSIGWSGSKNNRYRVYRCSANKNKGTCTSKQYRANDVEAWFMEGLHQLSESIGTELTPEILEQAKKENAIQSERHIQTAKNRYKRKVEAYTAGLIELEDLNEEKKRMEKVMGKHEKQDMTDEVIRIEEIEDKIKEKIKTLVEAINTVPVEDVKPLLQIIVGKIILIANKELEINLVFI
jgi:site-specific DNA recombinase